MTARRYGAARNAALAPRAGKYFFAAAEQKKVKSGTTTLVVGKPCATCPKCHSLVRVVLSTFDDWANGMVHSKTQVLSQHTPEGWSRVTKDRVPCFGSHTVAGDISIYEGEQ